MVILNKNFGLVWVLLFCISFFNICSGEEFDLDNSGYVDLSDLKVISDFWLDDCNVGNEWCDGADINKSGRVDLKDYSALAANWHSYPGLVGWWRFDEESGSVSVDSSGNGNNANLIGASVRMPWDFGNGLNFNGESQYVAIDNESFFDITDNITICFWVKKYDNDRTCSLVAKSEAFKVYMDELSTGVTFTCDGTGRPLSSVTGICDDKWHHVAAVYDGSQKLIYIDGVLDCSKASSGAIATNDFQVTIASDESIAGQTLRGVVDEVRIYNKALSAEDVLAIADEYFAIAHYTSPPDNAGFQLPDLMLTWEPGRYAVSHDIYFGTDFYAVDNATRDSNEYVGNFIFDVNSFSPTNLDYEQTYYWRIDEVNDLE